MLLNNIKQNVEETKKFKIKKRNSLNLMIQFRSGFI